MINDILDLSKIEAGREEVREEAFDLHDLITGLQGMFELRCKQKGLALNVSVDEPPIGVLGDAGKLRQVLVNLLGNAVKFTDSGSIGLHAQSLDDNEYRFEVTDTGPGIPPDRQAKIFEPFRQDESGHQKGGTGLGLAIARRHVTSMGGDLTLSSTPNVQTAFAFTVTLSPGEAAEARVRTGDTIVSITAGKAVAALVVDDVYENRLIVKKILERVMDIYVPDGSGEDATREIFDRHGHDRLKIVALSASVLAHQRSAYLEAGFDDFIDKPVRMDRVYACLEDQLGITFDRESNQTAEEPEPEALPTVPLPTEIWEGLMRSAEQHNVTSFKQHLTDAEALGEEHARSLSGLRSLAESYDTRAIQDALQVIPRI